jgi:hypothetical protein
VKNKFRKKEEAGLIIHDGEKTGRTFRLVRVTTATFNLRNKAIFYNWSAGPDLAFKDWSMRLKNIISLPTAAECLLCCTINTHIVIFF